MIFENNNGKLVSIEEHPFKLEKEIQKIFEENLEIITGYQFIKSEFTIKDSRLDTLAYDPQNNAFVIIEYKRDYNNQVIDQGFSYLNLMFQNKADFVLEYSHSINKVLSIKDIDWTQTRVVFVAPSFSKRQREATNFNDLAIELFEIKQYKNGVININPIKKTSGVNFKAEKSDSKQVVKEYSEAISESKIYTEEEHLKAKSDEIIELYDIVKNHILDLSTEIEVSPKKQYIAFKIGKHNIADIELFKNKLTIFINKSKGTLEDSRNLTRDVSNIGHYGNGDYSVSIQDGKDLEYILYLIKQAL